MATGGKKEDPIEKIRALIREEIGGANAERDRKEREAKDPWERLRGMIHEEVGAHFEAFTKSIEESEAGEAGGKSKEKPEDDAGGGFLKVLGL
jgi:hypothetical protein